MITWMKEWLVWWTDRVVCALVINLILLGAFGMLNVWERGVFPY